MNGKTANISFPRSMPAEAFASFEAWMLAILAEVKRTLDEKP